MFYSNVSSLSPHAKEYLKVLPVGVDRIALVECHKTDMSSVDRFCSFIRFNSSYNLAEPSNTLNHGGECVAVRSGLLSRPVSQHILDMITDQFITVLRFAVRIVTFKNIEFNQFLGKCRC